MRQMIRFKTCPRTPNCVSTASEDKKHHIAPIYYECSHEQMWEALQKVVKGFSQARITKAENFSLKAEFHTPLFGFVDDVDILMHTSERVLYFRSCSRAGYYDFGVNRRRINEIQKKLNKILKTFK